jgi:short subunit dehydrogenase-like uncharacterized protein
MDSTSRQYGIILYGATGYTGKYTAEYLQVNAPTDLKWAISGRSQQKLQVLLEELQAMSKDRKQPGKLYQLHSKIQKRFIVSYNGAVGHHSWISNSFLTLKQH